MSGAATGSFGALGSWFTALVVLVMDLAALRTIGPWVGLSQGRTSRAVLVAAWQVLVVPWIAFAALLLLFGLDWRYGVSLGPEWFVVCAVNNLFWWCRAVTGLKRYYEALATARFGPIPPEALVVEPEDNMERGVASLFSPEPAA